ncbi:hypothetical protein MUS1_09125 [Marinomonas ushuaiensis DSM 15871]|uniref:Uncharacterized protein n=1 Tax=Marinomonas ushuaiensis DSM 15871 TaxID=1122207 RepID=X7DZY3_9GAMM|nr:hypothetical protein MUS1_09125 [Marinomonas ushuaiensis DSM 15871]
MNGFGLAILNNVIVGLKAQPTVENANYVCITTLEHGNEKPVSGFLADSKFSP